MLKKLKRNKGFTLIEVLIAVTITVLLLAAVMSLFNPVKTLLDSVKSNSTADTICTASADYTANKLTNAIQIKVTGYDTLAELKTAAADAVDAITLGTNEKLYAFVITDGDVTDGLNNLYDLGEVDNSTIVTRTTDKASLTPYRVFNDAYFNNMDLRFDFKIEANKWVNVMVTAYSSDDNQITGTRENIFRLMNKSTSVGVTGADKDEILILYVIKTFTAADGITP